ncbi:MAG: hypothetical protein GX804_00595 [Lentisphaerae bacterium]|nr:hypothetical protein [Lentisphaerota bacterium]
MDRSLETRRRHCHDASTEPRGPSALPLPIPAFREVSCGSWLNISGGFGAPSPSYMFTAERYTFPVHEDENGTRPEEVECFVRMIFFCVFSISVDK